MIVLEKQCRGKVRSGSVIHSGPSLQKYVCSVQFSHNHTVYFGGLIKAIVIKGVSIRKSS
jgi:hypothetical protein